MIPYFTVWFKIEVDYHHIVLFTASENWGEYLSPEYGLFFSSHVSLKDLTLYLPSMFKPEFYPQQSWLFCVIKSPNRQRNPIQSVQSINCKCAITHITDILLCVSNLPETPIKQSRVNYRKSRKVIDLLCF